MSYLRAGGTSVSRLAMSAVVTLQVKEVVFKMRH